MVCFVVNSNFAPKSHRARQPVFNHHPVILIIYLWEDIRAKAHNIRKQEKYQGRRVKRGLCKTSTGKLINADVNGACNILKKFLLKKEAWNEELSSDLVEVCSTPSITKVTVNFS